MKSKHEPLLFPYGPEAIPAKPSVPADPCAGKHGGHDCSEAAWQKLLPQLGHARMEVLTEIRRAGEVGATAKEVSKRLGKPLHAISGRCSELAGIGLIARKFPHERRDGSSVLVALEQT